LFKPLETIDDDDDDDDDIPGSVLRAVDGR